MTRFITALVAAMALSGPVFAQGDPAQGEKDFKKCKSCHTIADGDNVIVKGGRTGPNLFGVIGRTAGTAEFKYSKDMIAAGEAGLIWTEAEILAFTANPNDYLRAATGNKSARSKMSFKVKDSSDIVAYLASLAPPAE